MFIGVTKNKHLPEHKSHSISKAAAVKSLLRLWERAWWSGSDLFLFYPAFSHIDQDHLVISSTESLPLVVRSVLGPISPFHLMAKLGWKIQLIQASVGWTGFPVGHLQQLGG